MKQKILALLLALAVVASLCAVSAMAEDAIPESPKPRAAQRRDPAPAAWTHQFFPEVPAGDPDPASSAV